ncbi:unnamed protein product [Amoebophrya sp. A120]|nr:unnamed protein product [Amoebophrya sp. A120]|eukprot:GSA120T00019600001.1
MTRLSGKLVHVHHLLSSFARGSTSANGEDKNAEPPPPSGAAGAGPPSVYQATVVADVSTAQQNERPPDAAPPTNQQVVDPHLQSLDEQARRVRRTYCDEAGVPKYEIRVIHGGRGLRRLTARSEQSGNARHRGWLGEKQFRLFDLQHKMAPVNDNILSDVADSLKDRVRKSRFDYFLNMKRKNTAEDYEEQQLSTPSFQLQNFPGDEDLSFARFSPQSEALATVADRKIHIRGLNEAVGDDSGTDLQGGSSDVHALGNSPIDETTGYLPFPCEPTREKFGYFHSYNPFTVASQGKKAYISKGNLQSYRCRLAKLGTVWNTRLTAFEKGRQGRPWDAKLQIEEQGVNPEYWQKFTEGNCSMKNGKENTDTLLTNAANKKTQVFDHELRTHTKNQEPPLHAAMPFRCYPLATMNPAAFDKERFFL